MNRNIYGPLYNPAGVAITGGTISGVTISDSTINQKFTTSTNPTSSVATTTAIVDAYNGVVITTNVNNTQTIANPTTATNIKVFTVINNDTSSSNQTIKANSVDFVLTPGEAQSFVWDGSAWGPTDLGITSLPVPVTQGGTGLTTITDHAPILGSGTDAVTPMAVGATKEVLVGSTGADPVWSSTPTVEELYGDNINVTEGLLSDPTITYVDDTHISVSSVDCAIRSDNSWGGTDNKLYVKTVAADTNLLVTAGEVNWIYISWNSGTPIYVAAANNSAIDNSDVIPVARVYMGTGSIMAQLTYQYLGRGQAIRNFDRVMRTRGTGGIEIESGLAISEGAGASVAVTTAAGFAWFGMRRITLDEITQGGSGVTSLLWYHSGGVWTSAAATGYNNTQYDNGTDLATLTSNRYAVNWIFRNITGSQICIVLGTGDYTQAEAEGSMIPSLPSCVENFSVLCGRIIVQKSATTAYAIEDVSDVSFRTSAVTVHNDLSGLNDGAYRHAPAAVADNDFIVGQASDGNWLKKTLAESRTILGLDGATTTVAVGGGASTAPVWTEATGTGAPVRATSPTLVTPILGTPASGALDNCTSNTEADNNNTTQLATTAFAKSQDAVLAREPDQGVALTAATSGSSGIAVADDDDIDYGTGNFFGVIPVLLADYTPAAEVVLEQKTDGTNGREFTLQTNGKLRVTINTTDYDSTVATGCTDNTKHVFGYSVTRETAAVAGSIIFVVDGVQLGDAVAITAGAPTTINNAVSQYVLGTSATRTAGTVNGYISGNRALTAAEHLALYRNGISEADKWGSQTAVYTSDFSAGVDGWTHTGGSITGNIDSIGGENDWLRFTCNDANTTHRVYKGGLTQGKNYKYTLTYFIPSTNNVMTSAQMYNATGATLATFATLDTMITITGTFNATDTYITIYGLTGSAFQDAGGDDVFYIKNVVFTEIGATLALEPEGIQPAPGQWLDSSTNKLHAMQPATGSSLTRYKKDFEYRWTNTWTASSAAQYVGGLNQAVLSADHFITDIITQATETTDVENLELGDGSAADKFVAAFTPSATRTKQTVAAQNDGTNLKLVYTPAAEATMTVETIIRGFIWEP